MSAPDSVDSDALVLARAKSLYRGSDPWESLASSFRASLISEAQDLLRAEFAEAEGRVSLGDRVRLWLGPPKRGAMRYGEVIGVDNLGRPGVQIRFDAPVHGAETCYATHDEVERLTPPEASPS